VGTWGIALFAAFALASLLDFVPQSSPWQPTMRFFHWILTENPFYPVQIFTGLYVGWRIGRRYQHKSMLLIWILPLVILFYALAVVPVLEWTSILSMPRTLSERLSFYFGTGCRLRRRCLDQLLITMPFYVSVAYSLGALIARVSREPKQDIPFHPPAAAASNR
jgi:hypothetical protein